MTGWARKIGAWMAAMALALPSAQPAFAQDSGQTASGQVSATPQGGFVLKMSGELVLTNVVARDAKTGELVRGLRQSDFSIFENGKQQRIDTFDFESVDMATPLNEVTVSGLAAGPSGSKAVAVARPEDLRNHRLIVMFFDLTSMQPEDLDRSVEAAKEFLQKKMQPADLVALVSLGDTLKVDQDFTADKQALINEVAVYNGSESEGFAAGATANSNQVEDTTGYTPDESEYNDINTDRELFALRAVAKALEKITEKKSLLYFSGGISRDGIENQASLRSAINAAVRANLAIYSVDTRGLQAISPLGDASTGSYRGNGARNGGALGNNMQANFASQEVMGTLSHDTGGKAFFDSNDFAPAFAQVQRDTSAYYAIGFRSSNPLRDGRSRKLTIKIDRPGVKLEYRPGYYAPADFQHAGREDRERELEEQLASDLPASDMALYLDAMYFRLDENRFFVPVSLIVPGSQIPFVKGGDRDKASLDIMGQVKDAQGIAVGNVRQTVKLALDPSQEVQRKNIQYSTGFTLAPGRYHLKFVVRENQTGNMGSFETDIQVPDLKKSPLKLSSVVLASQRVPNTTKNAAGNPSPLVRDGLEWVPNVAHVFRQDQHLYFLYEVYDPTKEKGAERGPVKVLTSIEFLNNGTKVYETPLVTANAINDAQHNAVAFEFDVPLAQLKPVTYICQVNVIDDAGGSFIFPRIALKVEAPAANAPVVAANPKVAAP